MICIYVASQPSDLLDWLPGYLYRVEMYTSVLLSLKQTMLHVTKSKEYRMH